MEFVEYNKNIDKLDLLNLGIVIKNSLIADGVKLSRNICILDSEVESGCIIESNCTIQNSKLGKNVWVRSSVIDSSILSDGCTVGPFAHIRLNSQIGKNCRIGNFVEIKASTIGDDCKMAHLTYVGDAVMGKNCNIGCGVVFCNYNGKIKQKCIVGDNVFIGSNVNLVAPLVVGDNAFIAAGSTITEDLPANSFAIERTRQVVKPKKE